MSPLCTVGVAALFTAFVQVPVPPERSGSELASAFVDALTYASIAREKLDESHSAKDPVQGLIAEITNQRVAKRRFSDAGALFAGDAKSGREAVRVLSRAMTTTFEALSIGCDRAIALNEAILKTKTQDDLAKVVSDAGALRADVEEAWRMLPQAAIALSLALLDEDRPTDGKIDRLRLSSAERRALVARLRRDYPGAEQQKGGHAIDVSASLLLKFLSGSHKSADSR